MTTLDALATPPFSQAAPDKSKSLLAGLKALTRHHRSSSPSYDRIVKAIFGQPDSVSCLAELPWLPVQLFKRLDLRSVAADEVVRVLTSSGTSGQAVSRIFLDRETASAQSRALVRIAGDFLGKSRMPMVIIDESGFLRDRTRFNARAAGILGFSTLGRDHFYLLDENLEADWEGLETYLRDRADTPILLFGFTFVVWENFLRAAQAKQIRLAFPSGSALIHGGGWKRLEDRRVSEQAFKSAMRDYFGISNVHNYYGMVEQVGSVYFECDHGWLHAPSYSDIIVRDTVTLQPVPAGTAGLIQVLSLLPRSYPGHSLLTEDLGTIIGEDDCPCGRLGKYFRVHGRLKNVEMRGCSDTRALPAD